MDPHVPEKSVSVRHSSCHCCRVLRSYYPLFPPALGSFLDTSLGAALSLPATPDVLLLPSNLAPFAKLAPAGADEDGPKVLTHLRRQPCYARICCGWRKHCTFMQQGRRSSLTGSGSLCHSVRNADRERLVWGRLFITHMHGDHCFGIPGVLRAIDAARAARGAAGPSDPVHIYGPPGAPLQSCSSCSCAHTLHSNVSRAAGSAATSRLP